LRPIQIGDKSIFDSHLSCCRQRLSDYSFANTFIWRHPIHLRWAILHDCLCVFANGDGGLTMVFPPLGAGCLTAAFRECLAICDGYNAAAGLGRWTRVEYVSKEMLEAMPGDLQVEPMSGDYVYSTGRMIDLPGGDLASKRQARNRFARRYDARTDRYGPEHLPQCLELLAMWNDRAEQSAGLLGLSVNLKRGKDVAATAEAITYARELGLEGMVLLVGDRLVGFTLGEMLDARTCSIVIEKTDHQYVGSAQYIFSEFCRQHWSHTEWCNVGDDWGVPSLAWTKQSYRPAYRLDKWVVRPALGASVPAAVAPAAARTDGLAGTRPTFELSRAGLEDLDALESLETRTFEKAVAFSRRQLRQLLRRPTVSVHVVRHEGVVVADALVLRRRCRNGITGRLYSLAVDPSRRRRGYGKALLADCLAELRAEGVRSVFLEADVDNAAAIALYESFGFRKTRSLCDYYGPGRHAWKMAWTDPARQAGPPAGIEPAAAGGAQRPRRTTPHRSRETLRPLNATCPLTIT